jgi:hypothetical protein
MGDPGGRIGLRPGGLGCGSRVPPRPSRARARRVRARWMIRDWRPSAARIQIETPAASGSSRPEFPPLALCGGAGDQFGRPDDGPVRHAPCGRERQRHGNPEDPVGGMSGRMLPVRAMHKHTAWPPVCPARVGIPMGRRTLDNRAQARRSARPTGCLLLLFARTRIDDLRHGAHKEQHCCMGASMPNWPLLVLVNR